MGRHRRSAAGPEAGPAGDAYPTANTRRHRGARRRKRSAMQLRTGLVGVSAAMAVGAVAVASGLLPGGAGYHVSGGTAADHVRAKGVPDLLTQGGSTTAPADRGMSSASASRGTGRSQGPEGSRSPVPPQRRPPRLRRRPSGRSRRRGRKRALRPRLPTGPAPPRRPRRPRPRRPRRRRPPLRPARPRPRLPTPPQQRPCSPWSTRSARRSAAAR